MVWIWCAAVDRWANSLQCASRSSTRPVLKHGPRSSVYAQVNGRYETLRRNESKGEPCVHFHEIPRLRLRAHHGPVLISLWKVQRLSVYTETRKMVTYACSGWSQRKLWWRTGAVLTCKSIVRNEYRGERLIEPSSSWFPPKFPSG